MDNLLAQVKQRYQEKVDTIEGMQNNLDKANNEILSLKAELKDVVKERNEIQYKWDNLVKVVGKEVSQNAIPSKQE